MVERSGAHFAEMYSKRTNGKKPHRNQTRLVTSQSRPGTFGPPMTTCLKGRDQKRRLLPSNTEVHSTHVPVGGGVAPLTTNSICALESVVTFQTRFGTFQTRPGTLRTRLTGKLRSPGPNETPLPPSYRGSLQTRVDGKLICALLPVVSFQTRNGTLQPRLAESSTGRGRKTHFAPFYTEVHR